MKNGISCLSACGDCRGVDCSNSLWHENDGDENDDDKNDDDKSDGHENNVDENVQDGSKTWSKGENYEIFSRICLIIGWLELLYLIF